MEKKQSNETQQQAANMVLELPNLNSGLSVKSLQCSIHPTIVPNVLDHYLRRPIDEEYVCGALLGTKDGSRVEI